MYKKIITLPILMLIIFLFSSCSNISTYQKSVYDDNSKIISQGDSYSFGSKVGATTDHECALKYGSFTGMYTVWAIKSDGNGSITVGYDSDLNSGKFKCVLITPDNEVINIFEQSGESTATEKLKKGTSRIKIVGNGAGGDIALTLTTEGDAVSSKTE